MATADSTAEEHIRSGTKEPNSSLPKFPGQDALLHEATKWRETRDDILSQHKLMEVAMGGKPDGIDEIVDMPLDSIPRVPAGHPMEYKFQMDYIHATRTNKANEAKRFRLWTDAWTKVYNIIIESIK